MKWKETKILYLILLVTVIFFTVLLIIFINPAHSYYQSNHPQGLDKYPQLKQICACESVGDKDAEPRHFNEDGTVLIGEIDDRDIGSCQISTHWWGDTAKELGYNLWSKEGNINFAIYLYKTQGSHLWEQSSKCWG